MFHSGMAQLVFVYQTFASPCPHELPSSLLKSENHYFQHPLLSAVEDGIQGEDFSHFGELLSFSGPLPCIHVIKLVFDVPLLIYLTSA